jgi:hypothetical protein
MAAAETHHYARKSMEIDACKWDGYSLEAIMDIAGEGTTVSVSSITITIDGVSYPVQFGQHFYKDGDGNFGAFDEATVSGAFQLDEE